MAAVQGALRRMAAGEQPLGAARKARKVLRAALAKLQRSSENIAAAERNVVFQDQRLLSEEDGRQLSDLVPNFDALHGLQQQAAERSAALATQEQLLEGAADLTRKGGDDAENVN